VIQDKPWPAYDQRVPPPAPRTCRRNTATERAHIADCGFAGDGESGLRSFGNRVLGLRPYKASSRRPQLRASDPARGRANGSPAKSGIRPCTSRGSTSGCAPLPERDFERAWHGPPHARYIGTWPDTRACIRHGDRASCRTFATDLTLRWSEISTLEARPAAATPP